MPSGCCFFGQGEEEIRVTKPAAMDGTGGKRERAAGAKGSCETRCTGHSDKHLKRKSCSAEASTIFESYLHRAKRVCAASPSPRLPFSLPARPIHGRRLCYSNLHSNIPVPIKTAGKLF